jgi:membrane-bound metal-dependent hydrolase YbcI (DUF457 family)
MSKAASSYTRSETASLRHDLLEQLFRLDFYAFEQLMKQLLSCSGYSTVHLMGRRHKRGRTRGTSARDAVNGGHDLKAYTQTDLTSSLTLTQIKQYRRVVSRRFVDELRGTMLRHQAEQGLLLTTSSFSRVARLAARDSEIAPITLLDGEAILDLLIQRRIGVIVQGEPAKEKRQTEDVVFCVDTFFFDKLQERYRSTYDSSSASPAKPEQYLNHAGPSVHSAETGASSGGDMLWRTHVLVGLNALWLLEAPTFLGYPPLLNYETLPLALGAAAFGSLLPDLDASQSKIKHLSVKGIKPFFLPALLIHRQLGHRGLSHSLVGLALVAALLFPLCFYWGLLPWLALLLGYASHLAADASTKSGIPVLYPKKKRYHLLPPGLRFTTGSEAEEVLFPLLALLLLILLLRHLAAQPLPMPVPLWAVALEEGRPESP